MDASVFTNANVALKLKHAGVIPKLQETLLAAVFSITNCLNTYPANYYW